jgi:hypothetical protein
MTLIKCDILEVDVDGDDFTGSFQPGGIRSEAITCYWRTEENNVLVTLDLGAQLVLRVPFETFEETMIKLEEG